MHVFHLLLSSKIDLATSPTHQSCCLYWQSSVPPTRREVFLRRRKWFEFTLLNYLLSSRRRCGRHGLSDNEGEDEADVNADEDNNEDYNEGNDDEVDNNDSIITQPPSPIVKRNARNERDAHSDINDNTDDNNNNIVKHNAREECDAHSDVDNNADNDDNVTITLQSLPLSRYEEFLLLHTWFTLTSPDYNGDNNGNNDDIEEEDNDSSIGSTSSIDFDGVDFGPILEDLQLICQNGQIRSSTGSYFTVNSNFFFTESDICHCPAFPRHISPSILWGPVA